MCVHFDGPGAAAEHDDAALMPLFTSHGELEPVDSRETALPSRIADQTKAAECDIAVEELDIHLLAVAAHCRQCALTYAV